MKYYLAIMRETTVHIAFRDRPVKVDFTREDVFRFYDALESVTVFSDAENATKYGEKKYYAEEYKPASNVMTSYPSDLFSPETRFNHSNLFGGNQILWSNAFPNAKERGITMEKRAAMILYEIEGPEESELAATQITVTVPKDSYNHPSPDLEVKAYKLADNKNLGKRSGNHIFLT